MIGRHVGTSGIIPKKRWNQASQRKEEESEKESRNKSGFSVPLLNERRNDNNEYRRPPLPCGASSASKKRDIGQYDHKKWKRDYLPFKNGKAFLMRGKNSFRPFGENSKAFSD